MTVAHDRLAAALADRYRIERELGQGGMATVYLAHDLRHERKVAIKVLKPELAAVLGAERFVVEIKTTAALQHPHILPLFDSGEAEGFLYYVMPFVDGETLRAKLDRETQLGIEESVKIATDVADALQYAHEHGVIHRDIKPENILLANGRPMVADFGIALAVSAAAGGRMTETGLSLGTPHYMSPEQATAEKEITARSDVYSLGAVLYEMLSGDPPHTGASAQQIIMKIITEQPAPVTTLRKSVPANVAAAVSMALEKLPADRFENAKSFGQALRDPGFRRATEASTTGRAMSRRDPWRVGLGALAVLAMAVAAWLGTHRGTAKVQQSRFALALPPGQELAAPGGSRIDFAPDGRSFVYTGAGVGGEQLWLRRMNSLDAVRIAGSEGATSPVFSPDGSEIAFVTLSPFGLKTVSVTGGQLHSIGVENASGGGLTWASNGYIYFDAGSGLARVRPDGSGYAMVMPLDTAA
ncbi:MAG TPA: protein kinase, partial [Gemmatimonadaceae bacterium]|nr:protein kinase [Gemmatimonadaceae bacterium]